MAFKSLNEFTIILKTNLKTFKQLKVLDALILPLEIELSRLHPCDHKTHFPCFRDSGMWSGTDRRVWTRYRNASERKALAGVHQRLMLHKVLFPPLLAQAGLPRVLYSLMMMNLAILTV